MLNKVLKFESYVIEFLSYVTIQLFYCSEVKFRFRTLFRLFIVLDT